MEELARLFPSLLLFLVLGVPSIIHLFRLFIDEKEKRINDIKTLSVDFQEALKKMDASHATSDSKLLDAIKEVNSVAEKILDRSSKNV